MKGNSVKYKIKDDIIFTTLKDNTGVLLRLSDTFLFSLNETGVVIWKTIEKGACFDEIVNNLTDEFNVDKDTAERDTGEFLEELLKEKLIIKEPYHENT